MRAIRSLLVLLVVVGALVCVAAALAGPGPRRPIHVTHPAKPVPASALVPKTLWTLPAATYPWVQPTWLRADGITVPVASHVPRTVITQPPAWIALS